MTKEARIHNGEKPASSVNGVGKPGQLYAKDQTELLSYTICKNNPKWIT